MSLTWTGAGPLCAHGGVILMWFSPSFIGSSNVSGCTWMTLSSATAGHIILGTDYKEKRTTVSDLSNQMMSLPPAHVVRREVTFSQVYVCSRVGGTPASGPSSLGQDGGTPKPLPVPSPPPRGTGYTAGGAPRAVYRRRIFLFCYNFAAPFTVYSNKVHGVFFTCMVGYLISWFKNQNLVCSIRRVYFSVVATELEVHLCTKGRRPIAAREP